MVVGIVTMSLASSVLRRASSVRAPARLFSSTSLVRKDGSKPPQAPKPIDDSTSALDYKKFQRSRPPPLPAPQEALRSRSAEEAVTNILYNTPPPNLQPFKKSVMCIRAYKAGSNA